MSDSLKDKFCPRPFEYLEMGNPTEDGLPCFCCCPTWVPTSVGDISKQSLEDIWNSKEMQNIRQSILDGSYSYCNKDLCPEIRDNRLLEKKYLFNEKHQKIVKENLVVLDGPKILNLSNDRSCNLTCPSCRVEKIMITHGEEYEQMKKVHMKLLDDSLVNLELIIFCSSGDPFASHLYRRLLFGLDGEKYPNLKVQIVTNGLLFNSEVWDQMKKIHGNIDSVFVSVDASTEDTYRIVRRGGELSDLIPNLEFLGGLRRSNLINHYQLDFVVQSQNYREMPDFVNLGKRVNADKVFFQKVVNWGTWSDEEYLKNAIWLPTHPEYKLFLDVLSHPLMKSKIVKRGNLANLIDAPNENRFRLLLKRVPYLRHIFIKVRQYIHNLSR
ncbi:MAG: SPASM domain-containing protein [Bacteriovoracaceae bacterium]|nr:SPASM domain-containing protein [Bacteriovoracaceae bacterium]